MYQFGIHIPKMIHIKRKVKTEVQLIYNKYKIHGDMKLAVKNFRMGNIRMTVTKQHKQRKLSIIFEMEETNTDRFMLLKLREASKMKHLKSVSG